LDAWTRGIAEGKAHATSRVSISVKIVLYNILKTSKLGNFNYSTYFGKNSQENK
jgi:hypothetical protein